MTKFVSVGDVPENPVLLVLVKNKSPVCFISCLSSVVQKMYKLRIFFFLGHEHVEGKYYFLHLCELRGLVKNLSMFRDRQKSLSFEELKILYFK